MEFKKAWYFVPELCCFVFHWGLKLSLCNNYKRVPKNVDGELYNREHSDFLGLVLVTLSLLEAITSNT